MQAFSQLVDVVGPSRVGSRPEIGRAQRIFLSSMAFLGALVLAGIWGVAAGSHAGHLGVGSALKVPLLLLASVLAALPLGLLVFRLTSATGRASDLVLGHAAATFTGTLVLALLAPIVALYQYSSAWAGPVVAVASAAVAIGVSFAIFLRVLAKLAAGGTWLPFVVPVVLLLGLQGAALFQLASISTPILPERTLIERGIDGVKPMESAQ
ncbi:hypothetical protein LVJ94_35990 [Pendulispora rubella]|uniref:Yip1 domain-containing protein n=1 Tax=Pendulispora rubella TaxID=2741070 RepID=A0ABZ2KZ84_9BACT